MKILATTYSLDLKARRNVKTNEKTNRTRQELSPQEFFERAHGADHNITI